ncbi:MAG: TOBE domain-containing protein, partial [Burkholderiales bacterium]|nr:TOBE domain-containing protein [Burkholderiales bacterium]
DLGIPILLVTHDLDEARLLADRMAVIDAGRVLQSGTPEAIHRAPRNARVADLVGIQNRFHGCWLGPAAHPGRGRMRWTAGAQDDARAPVLEVRDKGRLAPGQPLHWVIPGEGIGLVDAVRGGDAFAARVEAARHLGEISLATLSLDALPGVALRLTLSGAERRNLTVGARLAVRLDLDQVHVMPRRTEPRSQDPPEVDDR